MEFPPQEMHETRRDPALDMEPGFIGSDQLALADRAADGARRRDLSSVPRNAPCPCGSGKKYKHCHGATAIHERHDHDQQRDRLELFRVW